jgi:hypothetical protein
MQRMMKSLSSAFLIAIMVSGFALAGVVHFGTVQASTDVTGIIYSDTTWTKANSPYSLTGNVLVNNGVTLTIEAGATVNLNDFYIMVNGTLRAQGSGTDKIQFNGGEITFTQYGSDWNEQTGSGCIIENANLDSTYVDIGSVSTKITNNSILRISAAYRTIISHNTIHNGITYSGASGTLSYNIISGGLELAASGPVVSNNTISGGVDVSGGSPIISYNIISGGVDVSGGRISSDFSVISNNRITGGNKGISCNGYALISCNNISGCTYGIQLYPVEVLGGTSPSYPLIERNLITHNTRGITIVLSSRFDPGTLTPTIQNNTITHNSVGIRVYITNYVGSPTISYNNIHDNSDYNIQLNEDTENDINAAYNWWGTTDTAAISQSIYDFEDDFNLGKATSVPFLTEPNPEAMPIPEFPDTKPPVISVISPENKTYAVTNVSLTFTVNETTSWIGFSLDEQPTATISGNTTLTGLSDETHSLTVYATDRFANTGSSEMVYFTVDTALPSISILSPENKTYDTTDTPLTFTVNETTSWMGYSLDGQANVTVTGNTTLTGLSDGSHRLKVHAKDTAGNTGASETIYFSIEPFPYTLVVAAIVLIAVIGVGLLLYFVKVKKTTGKAEIISEGAK